MLVSLRASLHADMMECVTNFKAEVQDLEGRVDHIKQKMGDFASSHNNLKDANNYQEDEMENLEAKVANIEDCSKQNNVKLRCP